MRSILTFVFIAGPALWAQTYRVPLEIRTGELPGMGHGVAIVADDATHAHSTIPSGGDLRIERMPAPAKGLIVHVPDGEPATIALMPGQAAQISLPHAVGQLKRASYSISYWRGEDGDTLRESVGWIPVYRAEGRLKLPACEVNLAVFDFNGDGVFDRRDSRQATTLAFDFNHDGHFSGNDWHMMAEILDVCGTPLEVAELDPGGASITFRVSELKAPLVGDLAPAFSVPTVNGPPLRSADMRGSVHLLDFWASWCVPCVAELNDIASLAREYPRDLKVYGIDVDEPERRGAADRVIKEKGVLFPQVIREQGEKDFLWKMFGSMAGIKLSIPLFVVVDRGGRIRYAGNGGEKLADLKAVLERVLTPGK